MTYTSPKKELVHNIAVALADLGYDVYLAKSKDYGCYSDGNRVVSFGNAASSFCVTFSGNYKPSKDFGSGWRISDEFYEVPSKEQFREFIQAGVPHWVTQGKLPPKLLTIDEYLKSYGSSSGFTLFNPLPEPVEA